MVFETYLNIVEFPTSQPTTTISKEVGQTASFPAPAVPDSSVPTLYYTWSVDGTTLQSQSGQGTNFSTLNLDTSNYSVGSHTVQVKVQDSLIKNPVLQQIAFGYRPPIAWILQLGACEDNIVPEYGYYYESQEVQATLNGESAFIWQDREDTDEVDHYYTCTGAPDGTLDKGVISSTPWVECSYSTDDWLGDPYPCGEDDGCTCTPHYYEYDFVCQDNTSDSEVVTVTEQACTIIIGSGAATPAVERKRKEK